VGQLQVSGFYEGIMVISALMFPKSTMSLFGLIPMPLWLGVGSFVGYDLYQSIGRKSGRIDTWGHLGGAGTAAMYWLLRK
jgi:membrane associated rhomboid family serine protease